MGPMTVYVTGFQHLGHEKIVGYCGGPRTPTLMWLFKAGRQVSSKSNQRSGDRRGILASSRGSDGHLHSVALGTPEKAR